MDFGLAARVSILDGVVVVVVVCDGFLTCFFCCVLGWLSVESHLSKSPMRCIQLHKELPVETS